MTPSNRSGPTRLLSALLILSPALAAGACAPASSGAGGGDAPPPRAGDRPAGEAAAGPDTAASPDTVVDATTGAPGPRDRAATAVAGRAAYGVDLDTVRAGRFDNGKMWTFEHPPADYLDETYGFRPDSAWFRRARLGALRIPGCSASFVSPHGLVMTNHHCVRESVTAVTEEGERLLDDGFYARSLDAERPVEELHADRLVEIRDVSAVVDAALEGVADQERGERRQSVLDSLESAILEERGGEGAGQVVEMISLYDGARHSAYVFRRYDDVRLVMAPELEIGFFGGDPDNFTYPRYNLDVSFLRVYGEEGEPLETGTHFAWSEEGVGEDELVFVVGNPGSTSRLQTVAELDFRRDVSDAKLLAFIRDRIGVLEAYRADHPEEAEAHDLRNTVFSLQNSEKAYEGMVRGLHDPVIMTRRGDTQRWFRDSIRADPTLDAEYGGLIEEMAGLQDRKREHAPAYGAFLAMTSEDFASPTLHRALFAHQLLSMRRQGAPDQALQGPRERLLAVGDRPAELDEALVAARVRDLIQGYGRDSDVVRSVLQGRTPEGLAAVVRDGSVLADSASAARALEEGSLGPDDPAVRVVAAYFPTFIDFQRMLGEVSSREEEIAARLGRARFEIHGTDVPPDATFSLRLADGVVADYDYNGTRAPVRTTFYGLYDHFHAYGEDGPWSLPERWRDPADGFDLSTPLNFVSTADIIGGNSGSPVVNRDLEVVGVVFDGNIESLPGDYIYLPEFARAVAVDARGIREALDHVYDMDRIVLELLRGRLVETEEEADRVGGGGS